uniref:Fe2OG dioxygenase domain-containing protein n=2 Tax=Odontella aurita TaxID=265563 RepID=A0A7S4MID0_9STRA|mmetsp:Transcript_22267/g.65981  ORF Transcript_22267/g.65981 Transcript_22267/m.65981 type:complete len:268 (+) Transcript_22267:179-982(+)
MIPFITYLLAILLFLNLPTVTVARLTEAHRLAEYQRRNHTYPPRHWVPSGYPEWGAMHERRIEQVRRITEHGDRYDGWLQTLTSGFISPNFTEFGWGLTRAPPGIVEELKQRLHDGLPTAGDEVRTSAIQGELKPYLVPVGRLALKAMDVLKPMHEEWVGVPLKGTTAYGLRAYRNGSNLLMHVDKPQTHIISCILHIDHSEDSEPWPIFIEDFKGNTNEVVLESGDMLFYESSKCLHGRPRNFTGSWYSSIFVHYHPVSACYLDAL